MPTKLHKNTFEGGLNKDIDSKSIAQNQYTEAFSLSLTRDGKGASLTSIKGTTDIEPLLSNTEYNAISDVHILGAFEGRLRITTGGIPAETKGIVIFTYNNDTSSYSVAAYDIAGDTLYTLYAESIQLTDEDRFIDGVIFRENGVDYLYYTDYETVMKKIPLDFDSAFPIFNREEILLQRTGFRGNTGFVSIGHGNGGDLLCGVYQFAYRLFNSTNDRYTKWSLLSNPIQIGMDGDPTDEQAYGGVGFVTNADIQIELELLQNYSSLYDYYQLAVIENLDGSKEPTLTAKVLKPEAITQFNFVPLPSNPATVTYNYRTNAVAEDLVTVDDLTIDDAAIKAVKSISIKNNRLLAGNIKYHELDYDNNDPVVGNTTSPIIQTLSGVAAYSDYSNTPAYVGHWRDELYRYAISYFDEFGNYSRPKVLDFSSVTANRAAQGKDFRFPDRDNGQYGPLIDSSGNIQALGLRIQDINNHPSWAKGFIILRAPRKKKIQFQTPAVPSILVQPAKAVGDYPDQRSNESGNKLDVLNADLANPEGSYVPKNFFHVLPKNLIREGDIVGTVGLGSIYTILNDADYNSIVEFWLTSDFLTYDPIVISYSAGGLETNKDFQFTYSGVSQDNIQFYRDVTTKFVGGENNGVKVYVYREAVGTTTFTGFRTGGEIDILGDATTYDTDSDSYSVDTVNYNYLFDIRPAAPWTF